MKKLLFAGVATAVALAGAQANAQGTMGGSSTGSTGSHTGSTGSMGTTGSKSGTTGSTGTMGGSTGSMDTTTTGTANMWGKVTNIDKKKNMMTLEVPISPTASVTKDGKPVGLDQVKKGDDVRASFDPSTNAITQIQVSPKGMEHMPKDQMTH
jgi:hypothetical protein